MVNSKPLDLVWRRVKDRPKNRDENCVSQHNTNGHQTQSMIHSDEKESTQPATAGFVVSMI